MPSRTTLSGWQRDNANAAYAAEQLKDLKNTKVYGKVMSNIIVLDANGLGLTLGSTAARQLKRGY